VSPLLEAFLWFGLFALNFINALQYFLEKKYNRSSWNKAWMAILVLGTFLSGLCFAMTLVEWHYAS
jgi:hypothetical protein